VQVIELRPYNVPMVVARLGVEQLFVCQQRVQDCHDTFTLFVQQANVRMHRSPSFETIDHVPSMPRARHDGQLILIIIFILNIDQKNLAVLALAAGRTVA
jgi:hypothetical protein